VWVRDLKSELLLFELGYYDRLWPRASDPSVGGLWVACHQKLELLVAMLSCSAVMTHISVLYLCSTASRGVVSHLGVLWTSCLLTFLYTNYFILIER
jgi:hypothetical protein